MRALTCLFAAAALLCGACGGMEPGELDAESLVDAATLEGLDLPADYAGGRYVRVKGTLALGQTRTGLTAGRDLFHGYVLTGRRGETLRLRGATSGGGMGLVSVYGPQTADGSWGALLIKRWTYRPAERGIPVFEKTLSKAGKYLVVVGAPQRDPSTPASYSLAACDGECAAGACVEWASNGQNFHAMNAVSRTEANWLLSTSLASFEGALARTGSCGTRPRSCPRTRAPLCVHVVGSRAESVTYTNACQVQRAARDAADEKGLGIAILSTSEGACAP